MALIDEAVWRGQIFSGGWAAGDGGDTPVIEPATGQETRWGTIRGDIAPYPF